MARSGRPPRAMVAALARAALLVDDGYLVHDRAAGCVQGGDLLHLRLVKLRAHLALEDDLLFPALPDAFLFHADRDAVGIRDGRIFPDHLLDFRLDSLGVLHGCTSPGRSPTIGS